MQIKRYEASGIQEAMTKIRKDLGQDAVILSTRRLKRGKVPLIEVTAARDLENAKELDSRAAVDRPSSELSLPQLSAQRSVQMREGNNIKAEIDEIKEILADFKRENCLRADLIELKETVNMLMDLVGTIKKDQGCLATVYHHLLARGISQQQAYRMMDYAKNEFGDIEKNDCGEVMKGLEDFMKQSLSVPEKKAPEKRALAFIGPTGVGKTTTLAKLAAYYALEGKKKVGLIAADTYRIAAAEQLKVYGKIMRLPVEVAAEKESLKKAFNKFSDLDLILIDTPGKNQSDESYLRKMADLLNQGDSVGTILMLSLTSSRENLLDAAMKFSQIPYDSIIFTKIDECASCGAIYDVVEQMRKPVPYITNGQNVPKDIIRTTPGRIARLIMGNQLN